MAGYLDLMKAATPGGDIETKKAAPSLFQELGIYSPTEKLQLEQQSQQANYLMQQQLHAQAQQQQLALANSKAGAPQGLGFSQFLGMGGMQNLRQAEQYGTRATQAAQSGMNMQMGPQLPDYGGADPSKILNDALARNPDDPGKAYRTAAVQFIQLGRMKGNPDLTNIGATLLKKAEEADKERVEVESKKASTAKTQQDMVLEKNKAGRPGEFQNSRDAAGNIVTQRDQYDENGKYIGTKEIGRGPNKQTNVDGTPLTDTQRGKQVTDFGNLLVNSETTLKSINSIANSLEQGAAVGWAGGAVGLLDNVTGTLEQLAPNVRWSQEGTKAIEGFGGKFEELAKKTGIAKAQIVDLASSLAKTYNTTGTISEKDIVRAMDTIGGNISSPKTMAAVLRKAGERTREHVDTTYKYMLPGSQEDTAGQYKTFNDSWGEQKGNEDKRARPTTQEEYDKLAPGTEYWNPSRKKWMKKKK